jgi:hypothetical protein
MRKAVLTRSAAQAARLIVSAVVSGGARNRRRTWTKIEGKNPSRPTPVQQGYCVLLTYFDEVKAEAQGQPYYWLGGLMVDPEAMPILEADVNALARECFRDDTPAPETEFHATDISAGSKNFKGWRNPKDRFEVLKRLLRIINQPDGVFRVVVRLEVSRISDSLDPEALALMFLIEKINSFARVKKTHALLIGDLDNQKAVNRAVGNLAEY